MNARKEPGKQPAATAEGAPVPGAAGLDAAELGPILAASWQYSRDAMVVADCQTGLLIEANPAAERLTERTRDQLLGRPQLELHPESEWEEVRVAFRQAVEGSTTRFAGFHVLRPDREPVPVSISVTEPFLCGKRRLIVGVFRDLTHLVEQEQRLATKRWALKAYAAAAMAMVQAESSEHLLQAICEAITQDEPFVLAWVAVAEKGNGNPVRFVGAAGPALGYLDHLKVSWNPEDPSGLGPTGIALRTAQPIILDDIETDPRFEPWRELARQYKIRSSMTIPFMAEGPFPAALMVYSSQPHAFGPVVAEAFLSLAGEIGVGLVKLAQSENLAREREARELAQQELAETLSAVVRSIATAMEMRDPYTAGHQNRVAMLSTAIAEQMQIDPTRIRAIGLAAMVHDIGKIGIPAEILSKPAKLRAPEWQLVREHTELGFAILKDVPFHWPIAEAVRQHHERLDGSGYPHGLKGDEILLGARIIAVADVVESMASDRPYRSALGIDEALAEINRQAGVKLDREVVRICTQLFRERGFQFPSLERK